MKPFGLADEYRGYRTLLAQNHSDFTEQMTSFELVYDLAVDNHEDRATINKKHGTLTIAGSKDRLPALVYRCRPQDYRSVNATLMSPSRSVHGQGFRATQGTWLQVTGNEYELLLIQMRQLFRHHPLSVPPVLTFKTAHITITPQSPSHFFIKAD